MASPVLQFKRGASANVGIASFKAGEPGFTTDKYDFYIGLDGTSSNQKFFGSSRYWTRETGAVSALLKLVDRDGSNSVNLKSPDILAGIVTYTLPGTVTAGNYLRVAADGTLSWDSPSSSASLSDATLSGITTISGTLNVTANTNVTGVTTFTQSVTGTISTATRATLVDTTTAPNNTYYPGLFVSSTGTASTAVYVDAGISYVSDTDTLTLTGDLAVNGGDITSSSATFNLVNSTATSVSAFGAATALTLGATTGIATINNPTVVGTQATQNLYNTVATTLNFGGEATALFLGSTTGVTTVRNSLRVTNSLFDSTNSAGSNGQFLTVTGAGIGWTTISGVAAGGISTAARANTVDVTDTDAITGNIIFGASGNGATLYNDNDLSFNSATNILSTPILSASTEVRTPAVKAADGQAALTIANSTGEVTASGNLIVSGNLTVNGTTVQVNTSELQVYDRSITLGIQSGTTASTTTWDLGVLMNYGDAGVAKTSGVIWESTNKRFQFSANSDNPVSSASTTTPNITVSTFAPIEIAELWVNNSCVSNTATRIIGCTGSNLILENITIDAGTF